MTKAIRQRKDPECAYLSYVRNCHCSSGGDRCYGKGYPYTGSGICGSGRKASSYNQDDDRYFQFLCQMVAAYVCSGRSGKAGLRKLHKDTEGQDLESKNGFDHTTYRSHQSDERIGTVCKYHVSPSGSRAVETTAKVMDNALFQDEIRSMKSMIEQGRTLSDCLVGKKYFPQTMVDMCGVGEETGELEETLDNVADYYANEAEYRVQRLLAALEPTLLILLAIFAGLIVISIYLPIFTMYDLM